MPPGLLRILRHRQCPAYQTVRIPRLRSPGLQRIPCCARRSGAASGFRKQRILLPFYGSEYILQQKQQAVN